MHSVPSPLSVEHRIWQWAWNRKGAGQAACGHPEASGSRPWRLSGWNLDGQWGLYKSSLCQESGLDGLNFGQGCWSEAFPNILTA